MLGHFFDYIKSINNHFIIGTTLHNISTRTDIPQDADDVLLECWTTRDKFL